MNTRAIYLTANDLALRDGGFLTGLGCETDNLLTFGEAQEELTDWLKYTNSQWWESVAMFFDSFGMNEDDAAAAYCIDFNGLHRIVHSLIVHCVEWRQFAEREYGRALRRKGRDAADIAWREMLREAADDWNNSSAPTLLARWALPRQQCPPDALYGP